MRGYCIRDSGSSHGPQTLTVLASVIAIISLAPVPVGSQTQKAAKTQTTAAVITATPWTPPRTAWGDPDLQGTWNFATLTPLERPRALAEKESGRARSREVWTRLRRLVGGPIAPGALYLVWLGWAAYDSWAL